MWVDGTGSPIEQRKRETRQVRKNKTGSALTTVFLRGNLPFLPLQVKEDRLREETTTLESWRNSFGQNEEK